ncbi:hypothetical protein LXL04_030447 [Taraxacum kok-saghyz]
MERQPIGCAQSFQNRIGLEKRKQFMPNRTGECDSYIIGLDWRMPLIAILNGISRRELVLPAQDANRLPRRGLSSTSTRKVKELVVVKGDCFYFECLPKLLDRLGCEQILSYRIDRSLMLWARESLISLLPER